MIKSFSALLLALAAATPGFPQQSASRQTRDFVQASGQSDSFEILEAQTALAQSADPRVRSFAQQMIDDHMAMRESLAAVAAQARLDSPPRGPSSDQSMLLAALQSARGVDFDRMYALHQSLAHRSALAVVQAYAANGDQHSVREAATSAEQKISGHLAMADQLHAALGDQ